MRAGPLLLVTACLCQGSLSLSQTPSFVTRSGSSLQLDGHPFYFLGANAYYLLDEAGHGDTSLVTSLFATARQLGMTVVRTWAFFDSPDSANPAVVQLRPGVFNERALRTLDFIMYEARRNGIRLLLPLVNSWDDYGGMNQYVRWRIEGDEGNTVRSRGRYTGEEQVKTLTGPRGQRYRVALDASYGHEDFYTDSTIRSWYKGYIRFLLQRVNTITGIAYRDDPAIFGWELANEPRSSDRSGFTVLQWADDVAAFLKQVDPNHLLGTGEEGFDNTAAGYSLAAYNDQTWLFDGTLGVAWSMNSVLSRIDFGSIHLYPESWNLTNGAGNSWISDHIRLAASSQKPLVVGEFGVLTAQSSTYDSWLTTVFLQGGGGAMVWQLLEEGRSNSDGFGVRCPEGGAVCDVLRSQGERFEFRSSGGVLAPPTSFALLQNYPNPFNGQTTVAYDLPGDSYVKLSLFNTAGEMVRTFVEGFQSAGTRKELLDAGSLPSGAYFYRADIRPVAGQAGSAVGKMTIIK